MSAVSSSPAICRFMPQALSVTATSTDSHHAKFWTTAKIQKVALYALAALAAAGGCALTALGITNLVVWPCAWLSIPLFVGAAVLFSGSGVAFYFARRIIDYDDPKELRKIQQKAQSLSFPQLVKAHGLERVQKYAIVDQRTLEGKFQAEFDRKRFSEMVAQYPLDTIANYHLLPEEMVQQKFREEFADTHFSEMVAKFSLDTIAKYRLLSEEEMQRKYVKAIHADMEAPLQKENLSQVQIAEGCFHAVEGRCRLQAIVDHHLLPQSVIDLYNQFAGHRAHFDGERTRLDQTHPDRTERRLYRLNALKEEMYSQALKRAEVHAYEAAAQAQRDADQINAVNQALYQSKVQEWNMNRRHDRHHGRSGVLVSVISCLAYPSSPVHVYPAATPSADHYLASDISWSPARDAVDQNIAAMKTNGIGADDQAQYEKEMQAARQDYEEKITALLPQLLNCIRTPS